MLDFLQKGGIVVWILVALSAFVIALIIERVCFSGKKSPYSGADHHLRHRGQCARGWVAFGGKRVWYGSCTRRSFGESPHRRDSS